MDLELKLARDENDMKMKEDKQRLVVEKRKTEEQTLQNDLENKQITKDSSNEIKIADMELEKRNIDAQMLKHKALELASSSFKGQTFQGVNITKMSEDDASSAVLAGVL